MRRFFPVGTLVLLHSIRARASVLAVLALLFAPPAMGAETPVATEGEGDYQLGNGWWVPGTDFRLGGYASGGFEKVRDAPGQASIDHLSLFTWWEGEGKLRLFSELDLERPLTVQDGSEPTTGHAYLALERLYADYQYSERINLRAGKFLTPIGRWNLIHAAPLVWTTSRPLITERTFPTNATGGMLYGTLPALGRDVDYSVYTAIGKDWRPNPDLDPFREAYGAHVSAPLSGIGQIGISVASFEQESTRSEHKHLVGLDYFESRDRYELSAEAAIRFSSYGSGSEEKGLFVQGVAPLAGRLYAIGRYEFFDPAGPAPALQLWLAGLAFRFDPALILKAEFIHGVHNRIDAPEGFFTSVAVLF